MSTQTLAHHGEHPIPAPDQTTLLAMKRNLLAAERTLMAWIRTAISMIGFGFTVAKLFQSLEEQQVFLKGPAGNTWTARGVGMLLIALGTFALIGAIIDHRREVNRLRAEGLQTGASLSMAVGSVLAILGVMALLSVLMSF